MTVTVKNKSSLTCPHAEGLDDIRKGRVSRKFNTVGEMLASLKAGHKAPTRRQKRTRVR